MLIACNSVWQELLNAYFTRMLTCWIFLPFCYRVTKGVQSATANVQSAAQFVPSRQALTAFAIMIAAGSFFIFMAFFMFLPVIVLVPQKFAISFTIGCIFMVGSFFALKGPKAQFYHMISKEVNIICQFDQSYFRLTIFNLLRKLYNLYQVSV